MAVRAIEGQKCTNNLKNAWEGNPDRCKPFSKRTGMTERLQ